MASTFQRKKTSTSPTQLAGTKPWTGGVSLVSTGLQTLDGILGAGQPLGTCITVHGHHQVLAQYWCAEALSHNQSLCILVDPDVSQEQEEKLFAQPKWISYDDENGIIDYRYTKRDADKFLKALPRNLSIQKELNSSNNDTNNTMIMETLQESDEEHSEEQAHADDQVLDIAWQYQKSVQLERSGLRNQIGTRSANNAHNVYCHSYDLAKRLYDQIDVIENTTILQIPSCGCGTYCQGTLKCGTLYFLTVMEQIQSLLSSQKGQRVIRLLINSSNSSRLKSALPILLAHVRKHQLPVVVMIMTTATNNAAIYRSSDVVLEMEDWVASQKVPPPEFAHLQGLLHIKKCNTNVAATASGHFADAIVNKRPAAYTYGWKRDRRKLHLSLLHIPPDQGGDDGNTSSNLRTVKPSKTSGGCGQGGGKLDF